MTPDLRFVLVFVGATAIASGDAETSATLTLESVFRPDPAAVVPAAWPTRLPGGGALRIPPAEAFRPHKPAATASPPPAAASQPEELLEGGIQARDLAALSRRPVREQPLFVEGGIVGRTYPDARAHLEIASAFRQLCTRLTLESVDDADSTRTVLLLPPGSGDNLTLPPGQWRAVRETWRPGTPGDLAEEFPTQTLAPGLTYRTTWTADDEGRLRSEAERRARPAGEGFGSPRVINSTKASWSSDRD